ncbi:hypothetical protein [Allokutzneria albata]|uniref:Uncharacterized protein n=1 Tax=Allokutzneria albata TaxID=211114 RepID=A0A1G9VIT1_ALLAB|nr:hypothetical protein [Allokutzneria albata]SDM71941.1 hypothetical protein SAMN04489726_3057 [Allokutzneria albata]
MADAVRLDHRTSSRLWFVDHLWVLLTALVVLHHTAITYSGIGLWYYTEKSTDGAVALGLTFFALINQAWFMGAFFLLAGHFTPGWTPSPSPDELARHGGPERGVHGAR